MKWVLRILLLLLIVLAVLYAFRNQVLKSVMAFAIQKEVGLELVIGAVDWNVGEGSIRIQDLSLMNPPDFPEEAMIDAPEVEVDYDARDILSGNFHLGRIYLHIREFLIVRRQGGGFNISALKFEDGKDEEAAPAEEEAPEEDGMQFQIDILEYRLGTITYKDYFAAHEPVVQTFKANLHERYEDITGLDSVVAILLTKALTHGSIRRLLPFNPDQFLQQNVFDVVTLSNKVAAQLSRKILGGLEKGAGKAREEVEEAVGGILGTLKEQAQGLTGRQE